jgi:sugar-phosphatase
MEIIKKKVKAIIFDMDDTIIKTEHLWKLATKEVLLKRWCRPFTSEHVAAFKTISGQGLKPAWEFLKKMFNLSDATSTLIKETIQQTTKKFKEGVEFIPGFEQFHNTLCHHEIPTGIATNADDRSLNALFKVINLKKFFGNNIFCVTDVDNKSKPDPAIFLHTAEKLNAQPSECVVFEDSLFGLQAAKIAGMKSIVIKNEINQPHHNHAHYAIDDYYQAVDALRKIIKTK